MAQKTIKKKAIFITLEGLEGSGKSSVLKYVYKRLKKTKCSIRVYREPGTTRIGEKIRGILLDKKNKKLSKYTELLLYLAARTQLIEQRLEKDLTKYDFIICDRFFDSTLAYQGVALGLGKIVDESVKMFSLGISPDLTIFLDSPAKDGLARLKNKDRIESRPFKFHQDLRKGYIALSKKYPKRIKVVDARGSLDGIYPKVDTVLDKFLKVRKK